MTGPADSHARRRAARGEAAFIDAAAGSGKTETIVARIVHHLVIEGGEVDRVAAATFTIAAAAELRARVRQCLEGVRDWALDGTEPDQASAVTVVAEIRGGDLDCDSARSRATAALAALDTAPWGTLHSLCLRVIGASMPHISVPAGVTMWEDEDLLHQESAAVDRLMDQLWSDDWWTEEVESIPGAHSGASDLLDQGLTPQTVKELATASADSLVGQGFDSTNLAGISWSHHHENILRALQGELLDALEAPEFHEWIQWSGGGSFAEVISSLSGQFPARMPGSDEYAKSDAIAQISYLLSAENASQALLTLRRAQVNQAGAVKDWTGFREEDALLNVVGGNKGKVKDLMVPIIKSVKSALDDVVAPDSVAATALLTQAIRNAHDLQLRRRQTGRISFDDAVDLATIAWHPDSGGTPPFDLVVIDEVQDSDPIQHRLLERLDQHGVRVVVVGDKRQSIYRFRGASPDLFGQRRAAIGEHQVAQLTETFRHPRRLATALNELFKAGIEHPGVDAPEATSSVVDSLVGPPLRIAVCATPRLSKDARQLEARHVAAEILALRQADPGCRWQDVAILMPTRASLPSLRNALRSLAIPYVVQAADLSWTTDGARGLAATIRYRVTRRHEDLIGLALSPWIGLDLNEVLPARMDQNPTLARVAETVTAVAGPRGADAATMTRLLLDQLEVERTVAALAQTGRADLAHDLLNDARFVLDQACQYADAQGGSLAGFLRDVIDSQGRTAQARTPGASAGDLRDAVRITTIHGSKGLQYPHVLVIGLSNKPLARKFGILWPAPGSAAPLAARLKADIHAPAPALNCTEIDDELDRRADEESDRLLYVALTRAERSATAVVRCRPDSEKFGDRSAVSVWWGSTARGKPEQTKYNPVERVLWNRVHALPGVPETIDGRTELVPQCLIIRPAAPIVETIPQSPIEEGRSWPQGPERVEFNVIPTVTGSRQHPALSGDPVGVVPQPESYATATFDGSSEGEVTADSPGTDGAGESLAPGASGREFGIAVHETLECFAIRGVDPDSSLAETQAQAIAQRIAPALPANEVAAAVLSVLRAEPLREARGNDWPIRYEWPVAAPLDWNGQAVIGGGIIDIVIFAPDGARILDLKTDQVQAGSQELAALAKVYGEQLRMYAAALEVTGVPVASASLLVARVPDGHGGCAVADVPLAWQDNS